MHSIILFPTILRRGVLPLLALLGLAVAACAQNARASFQAFGVQDQSYTVEGASFANPYNVFAPGLLTSATDTGGNPITTGAYLVGNASNGTATVNTDGSFTYTPNANFYGTDSFQFSATGAPNTGTVTLTVVKVQSKHFQVAPGGTLNVSSPGVLVSTDGGQTAALSIPPTNASAFQLNTDGSFSYTPTPGFVGTDSFAYDDIANGVYLDTPTVFITVQPTLTITFSSPTVRRGSSITGTVTASPAPTSDLTVNIQAGNFYAAQVSPGLVTIAQNTTTATFTITGTNSGSTTPQVCTIYASDGPAYFKNVVTVLPAVALHGFSFTPGYVTGGSYATAALSTTGVDTVSFLSGNPSIVPAPASAFINQTGNVAFSTNPVASDQLVNLIATALNTSIETHLLVLAPRVQSVSFGGATSVSVPNVATLTVTLTGPAPTGGSTVTLWVSTPALTWAAPVTIPAGHTSGTVNMYPSTVSQPTLVKVSAKGYAGSAAGTSITVTP